MGALRTAPPNAQRTVHARTQPVPATPWVYLTDKERDKVMRWSFRLYCPRRSYRRTRLWDRVARVLWTRSGQQVPPPSPPLPRNRYRQMGRNRLGDRQVFDRLAAVIRRQVFDRLVPALRR